MDFQTPFPFIIKQTNLAAGSIDRKGNGSFVMITIKHPTFFESSMPYIPDTDNFVAFLESGPAID